jgi:deoxyribodipyrimidine photo-lyase
MTRMIAHRWAPRGVQLPVPEPGPALTFAPVPGFRRRAAELEPAVVHPWRWLFCLRAGRMPSYSAWRKAMAATPDA